MFVNRIAARHASFSTDVSHGALMFGSRMQDLGVARAPASPRMSPLPSLVCRAAFVLISIALCNPMLVVARACALRHRPLPAHCHAPPLGPIRRRSPQGSWPHLLDPVPPRVAIVLPARTPRMCICRARAHPTVGLGTRGFAMTGMCTAGQQDISSRRRVVSASGMPHRISRQHFAAPHPPRPRARRGLACAVRIGTRAVVFTRSVLS